MMMYQTCFTCGRALEAGFGAGLAAATLVDAVAVVVTVETLKRSDPATRTVSATRERLLDACEIVRTEFMNFVMSEPNSENVEWDLRVSEREHNLP